MCFFPFQSIFAPFLTLELAYMGLSKYFPKVSLHKVFILKQYHVVLFIYLFIISINVIAFDTVVAPGGEEDQDHRTHGCPAAVRHPSRGH